MGDKSRGLYRKFNVTRTDGSDGPGGKHEGCEYFLLDLDHDKFAWFAIAAYERACAEEYPLLAADLQRKRIAAVGLAATDYRHVELATARRDGAIEALEALPCTSDIGVADCIEATIPKYFCHRCRALAEARKENE